MFEKNNTTTVLLVLLLGLLFYFFYISKENFDNTKDIQFVTTIETNLMPLEQQLKILPNTAQNREINQYLKNAKFNLKLLKDDLARNAPKLELLSNMTPIITALSTLEVKYGNIKQQNTEYQIKLKETANIAKELQTKYDVFARIKKPKKK